MPKQSSFEVCAPIGRHPSDPLARVAVAEETSGTLAGTDDASMSSQVGPGPEDDDEDDETRVGDLKEVKPARTNCIVLATNPDFDLSHQYRPGNRLSFLLLITLTISE